MATANETTASATLTATLQSDGTIVYSLPQRQIDRLIKAYELCRACAKFPNLKENADKAALALSYLMLDLGIETE